MSNILSLLKTESGMKFQFCLLKPILGSIAAVEPGQAGPLTGSVNKFCLDTVGKIKSDIGYSTPRTGCDARSWAILAGVEILIGNLKAKGNICEMGSPKGYPGTILGMNQNPMFT